MNEVGPADASSAGGELVAGSELLVDELERVEPDQLRELVSVIHRGTLWMQELVENLLCTTASAVAIRSSARSG